MLEYKLVLNKSFYDKQLIEKAAEEFKDGKITINEQQDKIELTIESSTENAHLEFANYLIYLKRKQ